MLTIRLRRMGKRDRAFYRFVVSDSRKTPTASAVEEVGHYDPLQKEIQLDRERIDYWVGHGATLSNSVKTLIHRADHGGLAKPGTAAKAEPTAKKEAAPKEAAAEEAAAEEAAAEEAAKKEAKDDEAAEKKAKETTAEEEPPTETKAADAKAEAETTGAAETKSAEDEAAETADESAKEDTESA